jgi:hypothetical protein
VTGPDRRERSNTFLEPLELDELDGRRAAAAEEAEDPDVFERVTAVPGELPDAAALMAELEPPEREESPSGLFERTTADTERPGEAPPDSDPPPVLSAPTSSAKRPSRRSSRPVRSPSRPGLERASRRPSPSTPRQPAIELDLEPVPRPTEPAPCDDGLEADLGVPARASSALSAPPVSSDDPEVVAMKDRYATGDFSGALIIAEGILDANPEHEEARRCQARCTDVLSQMYLARLGSLAQVVRVALSGDQIRWLSLDHRAGFLLSLVDGQSSIETLLDISGMGRLEALRILFGLLDQRVIVLAESD